MGLVVYQWLVPVALIWGGGQALFTKLRHGDLRDKDVKKIDAAYPNDLAGDYVILAAGNAPGWGLAWMFPLGILGFGWNLSRWLKRREEERLEKLTAPDPQTKPSGFSS